MKAYRGVEVCLYSFFNLGAGWGGWLTPRYDRFTPRNDPVPIVQEAGWHTIITPVYHQHHYKHSQYGWPAAGSLIQQVLQRPCIVTCNSSSFTSPDALHSLCKLNQTFRQNLPRAIYCPFFNTSSHSQWLTRQHFTVPLTNLEPTSALPRLFFLRRPAFTGGPPYPRVIRSKTYRGYGKPRIIPNAIYITSYNVIFVKHAQIR
jgi:hypothetical protein